MHMRNAGHSRYVQLNINLVGRKQRHATPECIQGTEMWHVSGTLGALDTNINANGRSRGSA